MTKFNSDGKETLTWGEALSPAMKITKQKDADQYFAEYVAYNQKWLDKNPRVDGMTAEDIARTNIGYFAGYYDDAVRERVEKLFHCSHPIFGKITKSKPTMEEAFSAGVQSVQEGE